MGTYNMLILSKYLMAGVVFYCINIIDWGEIFTGLSKNRAN